MANATAAIPGNDPLDVITEDLRTIVDCKAIDRSAVGVLNLNLNLATSSAGSVQVEIQNSDGRPLDGFALGDFGEADEAMIRVGANTGDRLVLASPTAEGVRMPEGVMVVGRDELDGGRRAWSHEEIDGRRYRISADSFFQASTV